MTIITWALIIIAVAVIAYVWRGSDSKHKGERPTNPPPGPRGYPVLGVFPSLLRAPFHEVLQGWTKKYGNVFQFKLGRGTSVILGDVPTIRQAFLAQSPDVDSRCQWRYCFIRMFRGLSVLPYSEKWVNTRRRTLTILRDMGMGKSVMQDKIHEEAHHLMQQLVVNESAFNPRDMLRRAPMNTICSILFGERYTYDNPSLLFVMNTVVYLVDILAKASVYDVLPTQLRRLAGFSLNNFHNKLEQLNKYMHDRVDKHKSHCKKNVTKNFVDAWLKAEADENSISEKGEDVHINNNNVPSPLHKNIKRPFSDLPDVLQDIIIAGAHSTGIVFNWMVQLLALHKNEQDLAYAEIMETIGPNQAPNMADRGRLRRIEAIMYESLRISSVLPVVAQATLRDTKLGGYDVAAGTEVMYNSWALNYDEEIFPEPKLFKPDRWINKDGGIQKELFHYFFPFGLGKRSCAGESLARADLFITLATLLQNLEFLPPGDDIPKNMHPKVEHDFGLLADCKPFYIKVKRRKTFSSNIGKEK